MRLVSAPGLQQGGEMDAVGEGEGGGGCARDVYGYGTMGAYGMRGVRVGVGEIGAVLCRSVVETKSPGGDDGR